MTKLQQQLARLYGVSETVCLATEPPSDEAACGFFGINSADQVRCLVLEFVGPSDWEGLGSLWRAVQQVLALPAPAIAINGLNGYQFWFSVQEPIAAHKARFFLGELVHRHLPGSTQYSVRAAPSLAGKGGDAPRALLPGRQASSGNWAAFIAPDLAPLFVHEPWLDIPPGDDAQADLLSRVHCAGVLAFDQALIALGWSGEPGPAPERETTVAEPSSRLAPGRGEERGGMAGVGPALWRAGAELGPAQFLASVMNDSSVSLRYRMEAAKALLEKK
jgi:hypothetical protein